MSLARLLGLGTTTLNDCEILKILENARKHSKGHATFRSASGKTITVDVSRVNPKGIMWGNFNQYHNDSPKRY